MSILTDISEALQRGRMPKVKELVTQALEAGESPKAILEDGLLSGMGVIGEKFKNNEVFVPEVLVAARAMNAGVALLKEKLVEAGVQAKGKAVIGTVKGDLHDIGKNLVKLMLEGKGLEVIDLGVDVSPEKFVEAVTEQEAQLVCCSALLTTTMGEMKNVVKALDEAGLRDKVKIMVGGAPITQSFCDSIGADAYTPDAASAADKALEYCLA
ncbi:corrinoid methyltransferase [Clostridia bacterium]|nr:corrinoid methyltransferase [Clostridia bacterium]